MRYFLFVLLFIFSTQSFSGEIDGKGLDCKLMSLDEGDKASEINQMWWFNNGVVSPVTDEGPWSEGLSPAKLGYSTTADTIKWFYINMYLGFEAMYLDRKTLEITHKDSTEQHILFKGKCRVFTDFSEVYKRIRELEKKAEKEKLEKKKEYDKAREGNKI